MARKKQKKKTIAKKKSKSKKGQRLKKWRKYRAKLLQKLGGISLFLLVFLVLLGLLVFKVVEYTGNYIQDQEEEARIHQARQSFIQDLVPTAQTLQRQYGVLASVSLAQAALESDFGSSDLAATYHNLYGVKTEASDPQGVDLETSEFVDDEWISIVDRFKVYDSWESSMAEHARLIYYGTSWDPGYYQSVLEGNTYQDQAKGLQISGYATDPDYSDKLVGMIEEWNLNQYDQPLDKTDRSQAE